MSARAAWTAACAALLLCACTQPRPDSEWHLLLDSGDAYDVSVSRTRLQALGGDVYRAWLREDWPASLVSDPRERVKVAVADYDCRGRRYRLIIPGAPAEDVAAIEDWMVRDADRQPWRLVGMNTGAQQILDALCRYVREERAG